MLQFQLWKKLVVTVVLLGGVLYALPNLVSGQAASILPGEKINLGLDLRGGSHLLLRVDIDAVRQERLDTIAETIRQEFRGAKIRFSGLDVRDNSVIVRLRDASDAGAGQAIFNELGQGISLTRDNDVYRIAFNDAGMMEMQTQTVQQSIEIIRRRLDPKGTKEPVIQRQGSDRVLVQLPGVDDPDAVKRLLGRTAKLTFQLVDSRMTAAEAIDRGRTPPGTVLLQSASDDGRSYVVEKRVMVSGEMLDSASAGIDQNNRPAVNFALNTVGARKFGKVTGDNIGRPFAIVLDGQVVSAPVIQSQIFGSGQITGDFTVAETNELALILRIIFLVFVHIRSEYSHQ
jgi:preprotein translocase subunit SecD